MTDGSTRAVILHDDARGAALARVAILALDQADDLLRGMPHRRDHQTSSQR